MKNPRHEGGGKKFGAVQNPSAYANNRYQPTFQPPPLQAPSIQKARPTWRSLGGVVEVVLASMREPTEAEQRELRAIWWRHRLGHTLPPEPGLIVLDGGRP